MGFYSKNIYLLLTTSVDIVVHCLCCYDSVSCDSHMISPLIHPQSVPGSMKLDEFDPVEVYVAIADFEATEEANISLTAGQHVQVGGAVM